MVACEIFCFDNDSSVIRFILILLMFIFIFYKNRNCVFVKFDEIYSQNTKKKYYYYYYCIVIPYYLKKLYFRTVTYEEVF